MPDWRRRNKSFDPSFPLQHLDILLSFIQGWAKPTVTVNSSYVSTDVGKLSKFARSLQCYTFVCRKPPPKLLPIQWNPSQSRLSLTLHSRPTECGHQVRFDWGLPREGVMRKEGKWSRWLERRNFCSLWEWMDREPEEEEVLPWRSYSLLHHVPFPSRNSTRDGIIVKVHFWESDFATTKELITYFVANDILCQT